MKAVSVILCVVVGMSLLVALLVIGCGGGGGGGDTDVQVPTDAEITAIEQDSQQIDAIVNQVGADDYAAVAQQAEGLVTVEYAKVAGDTLTVKYKEGGREVWVDPPVWERPAAWPTAVATQMRGERVNTAELVGGTRAVLINSVAEDPGFSNQVPPLMDEAENLLSDMGYRVERVDGSACNYASMKNLDGAAVVGFCGHGGIAILTASAAHVFCVAIQTGERWTANSFRAYTTDWLLDRVVPVHIPWGRRDANGDAESSRWMLGVTDRFFSAHYASAGRRFSRALFYSGACSGLVNETMANALVSSGVSAYVGWTDTQHYGPWTMVQLFRSMQSGMNLEQAMSSLGPGLKTDDFQEDGRQVHAELQYRPDSGKTLQLGSPGQGVDPFRVTLTWERANDIDLHVFVRPSFHSYYGHKAIDIGELDVDDIDGYGPEHFTAHSRITGTYYVAANYYSALDDAGDTPTHVQVETRNAVKTYGPHWLRNANANSGYPIRGNTSSWWRVCDIQVYSDGTTTVGSPDTTVSLDNWGYYSVSTRHATQGPRKSYELQSLGVDPSLRPYLRASSTGSH